eukprot:4075789-Pyramimonas_sp.AAC.1
MDSWEARRCRRVRTTSRDLAVPLGAASCAVVDSFGGSREALRRRGERSSSPISRCSQGGCELRNCRHVRG